jgi:hypothetical protein
MVTEIGVKPSSVSVKILVFPSMSWSAVLGTTIGASKESTGMLAVMNKPGRQYPLEFERTTRAREEVVKDAIKIIPKKSYRERYREGTGKDPFICPHCGKEMEIWKVWHPSYGVIYDELAETR